MRANMPCSREEWFVPHETTITLPDGRELTVDGIPYEGWGTAPGKLYRITEHDDNRKIIWEKSWIIPAEPTESPPA